MIPFDDDMMMIVLDLPDMAGDPGEENRHLEKGPMNGMPESDAEKVLCDIYCMLKKHFGDKCDEGIDDEMEASDEL